MVQDGVQISIRLSLGVYLKLPVGSPQATNAEDSLVGPRGRG